MSDRQMHQIGSVSDSVGLSLRTIRHYEEVGLVVPSGRSPGGFRLFTSSEVDRLRLVKRMKPLNFSLDEIRDVLALLDRLTDDRDDEQDKDDIDSVGDRLDMYATLAGERCDRLREQLAAASELTEMLNRAVGTARGVDAPSS